jgi:hypothetical protein
MLRKQQANFLTICLTIVLTTYFTYNALFSKVPPDCLLPGNSPLGFGTILAVSPVLFPRRASLSWAANLTGLDIVIPMLPTWSEQDIAAF